MKPTVTPEATVARPVVTAAKVRIIIAPGASS
jgi:hypothetical protein